MKRAIAFVLLACTAAACGGHAPPAVVTAPKFSAYPQPLIPSDLNVAPDLRQLHEDAWQRLQSGDTRGANRDFSDVLKRAPDFYPAETGLGYVAMAERQFKQAADRFASAVAKNSSYLPALRGHVDAELAAGDDAGSVVAIEQLLAVEPAHDDLRNRADLFRLRGVQAQLERAARERAAGHPEDAQHTLERAVAGSPNNPVLLRELAAVELSRGVLDAADAHAQSAVQLDGGDAEALAILGDVLAAEGRTREASAAYGRAIAIDARPAWREKRDALDTRASFEALPADYRSIPSAATVTRGQLAAMIGIELKPMIDAAPKRAAVVMTDVRSHWAAAWILTITQASVMDALPNHTFQPDGIVRRGDLAEVLSQLMNLVGARRQAEVATWRTARPQIADVPPGHASYRAIAAATEAGLMTLDADRRFSVMSPVSGAELVSAVARLKALAGR